MVHSIPAMSLGEWNQIAVSRSIRFVDNVYSWYVVPFDLSTMLICASAVLLRKWDQTAVSRSVSGFNNGILRSGRIPWGMGLYCRDLFSV